MAETVTWDALRELAEFRAETGCAISFYLNLDPSLSPTAGDADTRVSSLLAQAEPVPDEVRVAREFYLAPLVPLVGRGDGAIVAVVGRERGQLFGLRGGRLEEIVDRTEDAPGRHDQGGWSQARYARHIEKLVHEHLRGVAAELDRRVRRLRAPVVIVSSEETRAEFDDLLSPDTQNALLGWTAAEAHATPAE